MMIDVETKEVHLRPDQLEKGEHLHDKSGVTLDTVSQEELLEWLAQNYKSQGCTLEFVTDRSAEGAQFVKGFGGIGGLLRYQVDMAQLDEAYGEDDSDDEWI